MRPLQGAVTTLEQEQLRAALAKAANTPPPKRGRLADQERAVLVAEIERLKKELAFYKQAANGRFPRLADREQALADKLAAALRREYELQQEIRRIKTGLAKVREMIPDGLLV
jgi:hypothetical protein